MSFLSWVYFLNDAMEKQPALLSKIYNIYPTVISVVSSALDVVFNTLIRYHIGLISCLQSI